VNRLRILDDGQNLLHIVPQLGQDGISTVLPKPCAELVSPYASQHQNGYKTAGQEFDHLLCDGGRTPGNHFLYHPIHLEQILQTAPPG
jgi:hypothetical protein